MVVTILSLVMSITVFVALQSFTGLLDASSSVQDLYFSNYEITNETVDIPVKAVNALKGYSTIESVSSTRLSIFSQKDELQIMLLTCPSGISRR